MSFDPNFDYNANKHYRTRAIGHLVVGPIQAKGYNNKVMMLTRQDVDFKNAETADRFMEYHRRRYAPIQTLKNARSLKMISRGDF